MDNHKPIVNGMVQRIKGSHAPHLLNSDEIEAIKPITEAHPCVWMTAKYLSTGSRGTIEVSIVVHIPADEFI